MFAHTHLTPGPTTAPAGLRRLLHVLVAVSFAYLVLGIVWTRSGVAFPFGPDADPLGRHQSLLEHVGHEDAAPYVVALAVLGLVTAVGMLRPVRSAAVGRVLVIVGAVQAVGYAVVVPDGRPLIAAAHVPILLAGKPFGWPEGVTISSQVPWPVVHQLILMAIGALWLAAAVGHARVARSACLRCGRTSRPPRWTEPAEAARWGRIAVYAAMATPVFYASTRLSWFVGLPFGVSEDFLEELKAEEPTIFLAGALIAALALGGATLTYGLVARWGERWPFWVPRLRGRPVRPFAAVVPGAVTAVLLGSAGVGWYHAALSGYLPDGAMDEDWATVAFGALLPVWSAALAVASYAYWLRRRAACRRCGRGADTAVAGRSLTAPAEQSLRTGS